MSTGKDLFQFVTTCDLRKVTKFLQSHNSPEIINYQNNNGNTSLIQACNSNSVDNSKKLVKSLLSVGVNVEISNQNGDRALFYASKRGYYDVVDMLLAAGSQFDFQNEQGQRPIDVASNEATKSIFNKLYEEKAARERAIAIENLSHRLMDMILSSAPSKSQKNKPVINIVNFLQQNTDYPEIISYESLETRHMKKIPIIAAVETQNLPLVTYLLNTCDVRVDNYHSSCSKKLTPLMVNCMVPLWSSYPVSPDSRAAENIRFAITQLLISRMSSISHKDKDGITTLMKAVQFNHINDVEAIFHRFPSSHNNTIDDVDNHGITGLMYAAKKKYSPIVHLLLGHRADPNLCDENGMTALMWASWSGDILSATALLDARADPNLASYCGRTAIMWAVEKNHDYIIELLISRGADPNIPLPSSGSSPLLVASRLNLNESIQCLITGGARMNDKNLDGYTPLLWAVLNNNEENVTILLENGASPHIKDKSGKSIFEKTKSPGIFQLLHKNSEIIKISVETRIAK